MLVKFLFAVKKNINQITIGLILTLLLSQANFHAFAAAPDPISNLTASALSDSQIRLTWTNPTSAFAGITISRSIYPKAYSPISTVANNINSFDDSGLSENTQYYYQIYTFTNNELSNAELISATTKTAVATVIANGGPDRKSAVGINIPFDGSASYDLQGTITEYSWDFGDNSDATSGVSTYHAYSAPDTYSVKLTATDNLGNKGTDVVSVVISADPIPSDLTLTKAIFNKVEMSWTRPSGTTSCFIERSENPNGPFMSIGGVSSSISKYTDTTAIPLHTYYYRIYLYKSGGGYYYSDIEHTDIPFEVDLPPIAQSSDIRGKVDAPLTFDGSTSYDNNSNDTIVNYHWNFGDSQSYDGTNSKPTHTYSNYGHYYATLTVTETHGLQGSKSVKVAVEPNPQPVDNGFFADVGNNILEVVSGSGYIYESNNPFGVTALSIADPANPKITASVNKFGQASGLAISSDNQLIMAAGKSNGTDIISLSDPSKPVISRSISGTSSSVAISGDKNSKALISGPDSIRVVDLSNPAADPKPISGLSNAVGVSAKNNRAIAALGSSGIALIDINSATPNVIRTLSLGGFAQSVSLATIGADTYAFIANLTLNNMQIVKTTGDNLTLVSSTDTGNISSITVSGTNAFVAAGNYGMKIYNIANPASPQYLGSPNSYDPQYYIKKIAISGNYAYSAWGEIGLEIDDIHNLSSPNKISRITNKEYANSINIDNGIISVGGTKRGPDIIRLNPSTGQPMLIGGYTSNDPTNGGVVISENKAIASLNSDKAIILTHNSSLASPEINRDQVPITQNTPWGSVQSENSISGLPHRSYNALIKDNLAFLALGNDGFAIYDISDLAHPQLKSISVLPASGYAWKIQYLKLNDSTNLIVADQTYGGIRIYNIDDIQAPRLLSSISTTSASDIEIVEHHLNVAANSSGAYMIELADPSNPRIIKSGGGYSSQRLGVTESKGFLFEAGFDSGGIIEDVNDPANPTYVNAPQFKSPGYAYDIVIWSNFAIIADTASTVSVFKLQNNSTEYPTKLNLQESCPDTVYPGQTFDCTIILSNPTPWTVISQISVSIAIDSRFTFISADNDGVLQPDGRSVIWTINPPFNSGAAKTFKLTLKVL